MKVVGYLRTSLIEWPGKISSVIFVPGCNFRCPYCHNSHLVDPQKIVKLPIIPEKEILADLKKRKKWVDGVVVTGGEPTLQPDLAKFLKEVKDLGFLTMIETNGSQPEALKELFKKKLLDRISLDVKTILEERIYQKASGVKVDLKKVKRSLNLILDARIEFELRTTIIPALHGQKNLLQLGQQLKKEARGRKINWVWQNFQPKNCLDLKFEKIEPYSKIELEKFLMAAKKIIPEIELK